MISKNGAKEIDNQDYFSRYVEGISMLNQTYKNTYDLTDLPKIRRKHENRIIFGQLNINSIRNKFISLVNAIEKTDVFLVSETKLDESFPTSQFVIPGFSEPFRLDRNRFGGLEENIPTSSLRTLLRGLFSRTQY